MESWMKAASSRGLDMSPHKHNSGSFNWNRNIARRKLTVHPRMSCLLISAPCSNNFSHTATLPSLAAYMSGVIRYLKKNEMFETGQN